MNVFAAMLERVQAACDALAAAGVLPAGLDRTRVTVEPPRDPGLGDMTTNAALVLAAGAGRTPRELADALAARLSADALVERAEVGGPGFVNIRLRPAVWPQVLQAALSNHAADRSVIYKEACLTKGFDKFPDQMDEANRDAVRFTMLFRGARSAADIDLASAREQSYDNPVFCVQYGYARARSVFRRAIDVFSDLPADPAGRAARLRDAPLALLTDAGERVLLRLIAQYPHVVETAAISREPQRVALYLHEIASAFHTHSRHGNATPHLRFIIQNDRQLTEARLALVEAVVIILAAGLASLGVGAPDEMR